MAIGLFGDIQTNLKALFYTHKERAFKLYRLLSISYVSLLFASPLIIIYTPYVLYSLGVHWAKYLCVINIFPDRWELWIHLIFALGLGYLTWHFFNRGWKKLCDTDVLCKEGLSRMGIALEEIPLDLFAGIPADSYWLTQILEFRKSASHSTMVFQDSTVLPNHIRQMVTEAARRAVKTTASKSDPGAAMTAITDQMYSLINAARHQMSKGPQPLDDAELTRVINKVNLLTLLKCAAKAVSEYEGVDSLDDDLLGNSRIITMDVPGQVVFVTTDPSESEGSTLFISESLASSRAYHLLEPLLFAALLYQNEAKWIRSNRFHMAYLYNHSGEGFLNGFLKFVLYPHHLLIMMANRNLRQAAKYHTLRRYDSEMPLVFEHYYAKEIVAALKQFGAQDVGIRPDQNPNYARLAFRRLMHENTFDYSLVPSELKSLCVLNIPNVKRNPKTKPLGGSFDLAPVLPSSTEDEEVLSTVTPSDHDVPRYGRTHVRFEDQRPEVKSSREPSKPKLNLLDRIAVAMYPGSK